MEEQSKTLNGMLSNLEDNFQQVMAGIGDKFLVGTKGLVTKLIEILDWVKVNIDSIVSTMKNLGNTIMWLIGAAVFVALIKKLAHVGASILLSIVQFKAYKAQVIKTGFSIKAFGTTLKTMGVTLGLTMNLMLGLIGVFVLLTSVTDLYSKSINKSIGDQIALNEQILTNTKIELEEIKVRKEGIEVKSKAISQFIRLAEVEKDATKKTEEYKEAQIALLKVMPNLGAETYKVNKSVDELDKELYDATIQLGEAYQEVGKLEDAIYDLRMELDKLEIKREFSDLVEELTRGGGMLDSLGNAASIVWEILKPSGQEVSDGIEAAVTEYFDTWAQKFADAKNQKELRKVKKDFERELYSAEGIDIVKGTKFAEVFEGGKIIEKGSVEWLKIVKAAKNTYNTAKKILDDALISDLGGVANALGTGLKQIQKDMKFSKDASVKTIEAYKKEVEDMSDYVENFEGDLQVGDVLFKILPEEEDESTDVYIKRVLQRKDYLVSLLDDEVQDLSDLLEDKEKESSDALKENLKQRKVNLKFWLDKRKQLDAEFDVGEVKIKMGTTVDEDGKIIEDNEEEKGKALISLKMKYQTDLMQLGKDFEAEYSEVYRLGWDERLGDEKKYTADNLKGQYKATEDTIKLYSEMYDNLALIREAKGESVLVSQDEVANQLAEFEQLIVDSLEGVEEGVTFDMLSPEQLAKVAPPWLKFLVELRENARETNTEVSELLSAKEISNLISSLEDLDVTNLDGVVGELNRTKDFILLTGLATDKLTEAVRNTAVDMEDAFKFDDTDTMQGIIDKSDIVETQLENINVDRIASINLIQDEDQRAIAMYEAERMHLEQSIKLAKARAEALYGESIDTGFTPEELDMTEDDATLHRAERLKNAEEYNGQYKDLIAELMELDTSRAKFILDLDFKIWGKRLDYASEFLGQMQDMSNALMQMAEEQADREIEIWKEAQEKRLDIEHTELSAHARTKNQQEKIDEVHEANLEAMEEEADRKKYEKMKGWFELGKQLEIVQIGMSTAGAIMKNFEEFGWVLGALMNIPTIAAGAAQIALVSSKQMPGKEFESGGYTGDDGSTRDVAGVVHKKEFVIKESATKEHRPLLEKINKGKITEEEKEVLSKVAIGKFDKAEKKFEVKEFNTKGKKEFSKGGYTGDVGSKNVNENIHIENIVRNINVEILTKKISSSLTEKISSSLVKNIEENMVENVDENVVRNISETLTKNISESMVKNVNESIKKSIDTENVAENLTRSINEILTRTVNESVVKTVEESSIITDKVSDTLNQTINESLSKTVNEINTNSNVINESLMRTVNDSLIKVSDERVSSRMDEKARIEEIFSRMEERASRTDEVVSRTDVSKKESLINETTNENIASSNIVEQPSLVGANSIVDIRRDMELSNSVINPNGQVQNDQVQNELREVKMLLKKYLENPVPSRAYLDDKEAKKITRKGVHSIRRDSL